MMFCIKNYGNPHGLSSKIHAQPQHLQRFEVTGPMGQGLRLMSSGIHIVFAAGTGVLCFVDLVSHLA